MRIFGVGLLGGVVKQHAADANAPKDDDGRRVSGLRRLPGIVPSAQTRSEDSPTIWETIRVRPAIEAIFHPVAGPNARCKNMNLLNRV